MKKLTATFKVITILLCCTLGLAPRSTYSQTSDFGIHKLNSGQGWDKIPGGGIRIAVDQSGNPWVVNSNKDIYQYVNKTFIKLPGQANDIAIGAGKVWVIGNDNVGSGSDHGVYEWNGAGWNKAVGGGTSIAVDANGLPWITNSVKDIYQYTSPSQFVKLPGQANDIAIGAGKVWVIGNDNVGSGSDHGVYEWNGTGWNKAVGGGTSIAVNSYGLPWIANSVKDIYQYTSPSQFVKLSGQANDIAIGGGNVVCVIGNDLPDVIQKTHGMYLDDLLQGKTVTIPEEIDCHAYMEFFILVGTPKVKLIGDKPFDIYWETNRLGIYSISNVEHAIKTKVVKDGETRYAYIWEKDETIPVNWARAGISVRNPNLPLHLMQLNGPIMPPIGIGFNFSYLLNK